MSQVLCDINFYYPEIEDAKLFRCEITEKIMKNAFDYLIEERRGISLPNEEGPDTTVHVHKNEEGYTWHVIDFDYDDDFYVESQTISLNKLKEIISQQKQSIECKWFCNPYAKSPFSKFDPEMEFLYEKMMAREEVISYFDNKKSSESWDYIRLYAPSNLRGIMYQLAEEVPSIAFELIDLLTQNKSTIEKGFNHLASRWHNWLLTKQLISNLTGSLEDFPSNGMIVIQEFDVFLSQCFREFNERLRLSSLIKFTQKTLSKCFIEDIKLQLNSHNLNLSQYLETGTFSLTIPVVSKKCPADKLGSIAITFEPLKNRMLDHALKVARPHEVFSYLMDCIKQMDYTQSGVLDDSCLHISEVTWISEDSEIKLISRN